MNNDYILTLLLQLQGVTVIVSLPCVLWIVSIVVETYRLAYWLRQEQRQRRFSFLKRPLKGWKRRERCESRRIATRAPVYDTHTHNKPDTTRPDMMFERLGRWLQLRASPPLKKKKKKGKIRVSVSWFTSYDVRIFTMSSCTVLTAEKEARKRDFFHAKFYETPFGIYEICATDSRQPGRINNVPAAPMKSPTCSD